jgi:hypothetical protein
MENSKKSKKGKNAKILKSKNNLNLRSTIHQEYDSIWKQLFNSSRGQSCKGASLKQEVIATAKAAAAAVTTSQRGEKAKAGKFGWVKNWGYGESAYFIDYLDPVLRKDVLKEFHTIYDEMMKFPSEDSSEYSDPFDLKKLLTAEDAALKSKAMNDLKLLNKNYDPKIYSISVNAVQLHQAMKDWKWSIDFAGSDFAKTFIKKYDMNGDGRLNPRELLLGAIDHNKHLFGSQSCTHCFEDVVKKLDAIFIYVDCDNDGVVSAEDLWNNMAGLKRSSAKNNIFALGLDAGIRTASVNDFVLKNMNASNGMINKVEFRNAIILAMWDRQTDFMKIIEDDERSLKELRWKDDNMVDIKGAQYVTSSLVNEAKRNSNKLV